LKKDVLEDMIKGRFEIAHIPWIILFFSLYSLQFKTQSAIVEFNMANSFRIFMVSLAGTISILLIITKKNGIRQLFSLAVGCLLLYGVVALLSGSYASVGLYAIWKAVEVIADVLAIVAVLSSASQRTSLSGLYRIGTVLFMLLLMCILLGAFAMPSQAFLHVRGLFHFQLSGVIPRINPNGVAFVGAFVGLVSFIRFLQDKAFTHRLFYGCFFAASFVTMILAQSRTSLIGFVLAVITFLLFDRRRKLLAVTLGLIIFALSIETTISFLQREQSKGLAMSLSGRTVAWKASWELFKQSPYIGNGFASAGRFDVLKGGSVSTLHGSLFDVLAGVGLFGLIPWLTAIFYTGIRLIFPRGRPKNRPRTSFERGGRAELVAVMILILIRAITSSSLALHENTFLLFLILLAFSVTPETTAHNKPSNSRGSFAHARNSGT
jgi:hypothetical protein